MNENTEDEPEQATAKTLQPLMTDTERKAARALADDVSLPGVGARRETTDEIFTALSHPGRRYVLTYLLRSEGYVTMTDLVDYVMERAHPVKSEEFRRRVTIELTHNHLPKLDEENLINYNMERQLVSPTDKTALTGPFLKVALVLQEELTDSEMQ
jgi:hypothetical protein